MSRRRRVHGDDYDQPHRALYEPRATRESIGFARDEDVPPGWEPASAGGHFSHLCGLPPVPYRFPRRWAEEARSSGSIAPDILMQAIENNATRSRTAPIGRSTTPRPGSPPNTPAPPRTKPAGSNTVAPTSVEEMNRPLAPSMSGIARTLKPNTMFTSPSTVPWACASVHIK